MTKYLRVTILMADGGLASLIVGPFDTDQQMLTWHDNLLKVAYQVGENRDTKMLSVALFERGVPRESISAHIAPEAAMRLIIRDYQISTFGPHLN